MSTPDQIENDIDRTRRHLSDNVDRLTDKVSPGKIAERRADAVKTKFASARDRVMGSSDGGNGPSGARDAVVSKVNDLGSATNDAKAKVRRQTAGNPIAAGLVAFGVGWLLSSLAPAAAAEQEVAARAEAAAKDHLVEPAKQSAHEIADNLKEPVTQAAGEVKSTATDAASDTVDHAKGAAQDVKEPLQQ